MNTGSSARITLAQMRSSIDQVPMLPIVVARLLSLSPHAEDYFEQVVGLVSIDPPFLARVLQSANSASSAAASPIVTIERAVARIGANSVASLVTSSAVMKVFVPNSEGERKLWSHSIQVAVGTRTIAKFFPAFEISPECAYLAGLFHDIGRFIMFGLTPEQFKTDEYIWLEDFEKLLQSELEIFECNHSELGYEVCQKWGIPETIADVVNNHHQDTSSPRTIDQLKNNGKALLTLVQITDALSAGLLGRADFADTDESFRSEWIKTLCARPAFASLPNIDQLLERSCMPIWEESNQLASELGVV